MKENIKIKEVVLKVSNLENSVKFYQTYVGLELISNENGIVSMGVNGEVLLKMYVPEDVVVSNNQFTGLYHVAFLLPTENDLGRLLMHYQELGFYKVGAGDHIYSQALYIYDPDRNGIEIYADRDKSKWDYDAEGKLSAATLSVDVDRLLTLTEGKKWEGMPSGSKIGHVHLQVKDIKKVKEFYVDFLGMQIMTEFPTALFVSKDGYHHHVGSNIWQGTRLQALPDNYTGLDYYTIIASDYEKYLTDVKKSAFQYKIEPEGIKIIDDNHIKIRIVKG